MTKIYEFIIFFFLIFEYLCSEVRDLSKIQFFNVCVGVQDFSIIFYHPKQKI